MPWTYRGMARVKTIYRTHVHRLRYPDVSRLLSSPRILLDVQVVRPGLVRNRVRTTLIIDCVGHHLKEPPHERRCSRGRRLRPKEAP